MRRRPSCQLAFDFSTSTEGDLERVRREAREATAPIFEQYRYLITMYGDRAA